MKLFLPLFFIIPLFSLYAVPENYEARVAMREIITAPTNDVLEARSEIIRQMSDGSMVSFKVKMQNDSFYLLFINEKNNDFPVYSEGTYIIKRNLDDGKFVQIKVFFKDHTECYARIYPLDERAMMEVVLYGTTIYTDINLPFSFADVLVEPFHEVMAASSGIVDWDLIFPEDKSFLFDVKYELYNSIKQELPLLRDADDGAMDENGNFIYIEDLSPQPDESAGFNCSGFVKWIGDAFYWRETGQYLSVAELKAKHLELRGNRWSARHEDDRDPYFGLDWTRNISVAIEEARKVTDLPYDATDVKNIPWLSYTDDIGYPVESLKLIMYYLAVTEPQNIYLASVNVPWGTEPILQQHIHTAALIPIMDEDGAFKDVVFERNFESNAELLAENYPDAHIHLARIKTQNGFKLPELEKKPSVGTGSFFRR